MNTIELIYLFRLEADKVVIMTSELKTSTTEADQGPVIGLDDHTSASDTDRTAQDSVAASAGQSSIPATATLAPVLATEAKTSSTDVRPGKY